MNTPDTEWETNDWENEVHTFVNELAMQLKPSNDTMDAVRLIRNDLPDFIKHLRTPRDTYWKERDKKLRLHLGVILPMAKGYVHTNDVGRNREMVSNAEDFLAELDNIE